MSIDDGGESSLTKKKKNESLKVKLFKHIQKLAMMWGSLELSQNIHIQKIQPGKIRISKIKRYSLAAYLYPKQHPI